MSFALSIEYNSSNPVLEDLLAQMHMDFNSRVFGWN